MILYMHYVYQHLAPVCAAHSRCYHTHSCVQPEAQEAEAEGQVNGLQPRQRQCSAGLCAMGAAPAPYHEAAAAAHALEVEDERA